VTVKTLSVKLDSEIHLLVSYEHLKHLPICSQMSAMIVQALASFQGPLPVLPLTRYAPEPRKQGRPCTCVQNFRRGQDYGKYVDGFRELLPTDPPLTKVDEERIEANAKAWSRYVDRAKQMSLDDIRNLYRKARYSDRFIAR
jgi:hypothetical protein